MKRIIIFALVICTAIPSMSSSFFGFDLSKLGGPKKEGKEEKGGEKVGGFGALFANLGKSLGSNLIKNQLESSLKKATGIDVEALSKKAKDAYGIDIHGIEDMLISEGLDAAAKSGIGVSDIVNFATSLSNKLEKNHVNAQSANKASTPTKLTEQE